LKEHVASIFRVEEKAKQETRKQSSASYPFHGGFLLGLFLNPEDGSDMFLRNAGWLLSEYMALYPRR
jgi:hypothetical protein